MMIASPARRLPHDDDDASTYIYSPLVFPERGAANLRSGAGQVTTLSYHDDKRHTSSPKYILILFSSAVARTLRNIDDFNTILFSSALHSPVASRYDDTT